MENDKERESSGLHGFRLNLSNPDHMLIHRTLSNLDPNLYKSKNTFIIDALEKYIKGITPEVLIGSTAGDKDYVSRAELEDLKAEIEEVKIELSEKNVELIDMRAELVKEVTREVTKNMYSGIAAAFAGGEFLGEKRTQERDIVM